jgi:glutamyl-tRNA synthetase
LNWLNAYYIKAADLDALSKEVAQRLYKLNISVQSTPSLHDVLALYRERANNLNQLALDVAYFYTRPQANEADVEKHITSEIKPVIETLYNTFKNIAWTPELIHEAIDAAVKDNSLKFPKVAMPLRVMIAGIAQSPSIDQVMAILGKQEVLNRIEVYLK